MSQHIHEELEVGQHLDQAARSTLTAVAQLVERLARSAAERDRAAAQAIRDALYQQQTDPRTVRENTRPGDATVSPSPEEGETVQVPPGSSDPTIALPVDPSAAGDAAAADRVQEVVRDYLDRAEGSGAEQVAHAWQQAMTDVAGRPEDPVTAEAARHLHHMGQARYGVDLADGVDRLLTSPPDGPEARPGTTDRASVLRDALADASANIADGRAMDTASDAAAREQAAVERVVLPAYRANHDRGVSPTKAATPAEGEHRRQTWAMARADWETTRPDLTNATQRRDAWEALPITDKTELYWSKYDTVQARTVATPSAPVPREATTAQEKGPQPERGIAPSKASTPEERERRTRAWAQAEAEFTTLQPDGTTAKEAHAAWRDLSWQDRSVLYYKAYDSPELRALVGPSTAAATPQVAAQGPETVPATAASTSAPVEEPTRAREAGEARVPRDRVVALNAIAADYYTSQMTEDSKGRTYLEEHLGQDVVADGAWRLGYAPAGWTGLTGHLRAAGASDAEIVGAGLGIKSSRGTVVDLFRDRAMIAIRDVTAPGDVVGFVGRDLSGDTRAPKYLNTRGTAAFTKGDQLLGLTEAPVGARLVRVEGPMDAIAITAAGRALPGPHRYAGIAPMGTALTERQADLIAAHVQNEPGQDGRVWVALDNDKAGRAATAKDYEPLRERGVDARLITVLPGSDPAQMWREEPGLLTATLDVADYAPTAALAVVEHEIDAQRDALRAGDTAAHEELAATVDRLNSALATTDREQVNRYAETSVNALTARPAEDTTLEGPKVDSDPDLDASAAATPEPDRGQDDRRDQDQAEQPRTTPGLGRAVEEAAVAGAAVTVMYDRAEHLKDGTLTDPEAIAARAVSAAAFSKPTSDMLATANTTKGVAATPATDAPTLQQNRHRSR